MATDFMSHCIVSIVRFYTPVKDGSYYVVPYVRPFVNYWCLVSIFVTHLKISLKLGSNIHLNEAMCGSDISTMSDKGQGHT